VRKNWTGLLPVPGDGGYEWQGFVPTGELPHSVDPPGGFIVTANQKMTPPQSRYALGFEWSAPVRYRRAVELLEAARDSGHKLDMVDMQALQTDVVSRYARALQPLLRAALAARHAGKASVPESEEDPAAAMLLGWDGSLSADSGAAALYEFWILDLRRTISALLVPEAARAAIGDLSLPQTIAALADPDAQVTGSEPATNAGEVLLGSLARASDALTARQGADPRQWSWGRLHQVHFRHPLDQMAGAAPLLDPDPVQRPGDEDVLQATAFEDDSFDQIDGASYREVFDLSDWDRSVAINVPGQSGQPGSPHYQDLLPLWRDGRYFPLAYTKAAVDRVTTDSLLLVPRAPL
jgi:penicillin amidase